ncbi:trypsin-like peptidase domain-containing protein [Hydrogenoanaerobacterium saccharovorans]|uniref:Trypsin-like peptidase domain-containing protein n=2 Tax=Hydrogenoanaerobacterium saccharovorans TaxID=474960 RepID=A0ABS2GKK7_9FIRM|nr:trypsin-like peptidase domain-containing protein [Hydrogenoanaerobacterium saccharovorans]
MNDNREYPNGEPMDETRRNTNGNTEQGNGEIHSDDRIYPPRNGSADQERMSGYASTGYGGVHSGPDHNSGNTGNPNQGEERRDYGVDPFSAGQNRRSDRPYGMTGTYEWNFADYDQQSSAPARDQAARKKRGRMAAILVGCLVGVFALAFCGYSIYSAIDSSRVEQDNSSSEVSALPGLNIQDTPSDSDTTVSSDGKLSDKEIIKKVSPAVVGIECYAFGNSFTPSSSGSGIIMTADGYIVTNAHVVEDAAGITVVLENGDAYAAELIGADSDTDLAVLKIEASNLTYAEFGNSDELERGDRVIAIGNPGGTVLAGSTTGGMVSGLNRNINSSSPYSTSYIQVDAAINPGNSGGALVNEYGQVVGINSAKIAETDYEGIGFAIPINEALPIIQELMQYGHVTGRAALGIQGYMINEAVAAMRRMPVGFGIEAVDPSSDLASKNVVAGDIITYINDKQVTSYDVLANELAEFKPGDTVKLTIYRSSSSGGAGRSFEVNVVLIESAGE